MQVPTFVVPQVCCCHLHAAWWPTPSYHVVTGLGRLCEPEVLGDSCRLVAVLQARDVLSLTGLDLLCAVAVTSGGRCCCLDCPYWHSRSMPLTGGCADLTLSNSLAGRGWFGLPNCNSLLIDGQVWQCYQGHSIRSDGGGGGGRCDCCGLIDHPTLCK